MAAELACQFALFLPDRVFVLGLEFGEGFPVMGVLAIQEDAGRLVAEGAFGSGHEVESAIGPWGDHIVLQEDGPAEGGLDQG